MTWLLANWRLVLSFALAGVLFITGWNFGASSVQSKLDKQTIQVQQDALAVMAAHTEMVKQAEVQHGKDQTTIDKLHNQLDGMLVHLPQTCQNIGGQGGNSSAGVLYGSADTAFTELQRGDNEDFARCDRINIDAIRINTIISK